MAKQSCCNDDEMSTKFEIEAVVSFDDRGQLVLPKEMRKKFDMKAGDKFAIVSCCEGENLCCLTFIKSTALNAALSSFITPVLSGLSQSK